MTDPKDFMAQAKAQMDAWGTEMTKMQAKMMEAGTAGQAQMAKQMEALTEQRKHAEAQMAEFGKANMDAAKGVQDNMQKAWKDMEG
ncbi:MAG: hypothetical protein JKY00_07010, partial [Roseicyclus sp.]|nr:hypothetical protein [Roseicyclus sp.]